MPADRNLHQILDAIFDSSEEEFIAAADLMLRTILRGAVSSQHIKRFPKSSTEAVNLAVKRSIRQRGEKHNV